MGALGVSMARPKALLVRCRKHAESSLLMQFLVPCYCLSAAW